MKRWNRFSEARANDMDWLETAKGKIALDDGVRNVQWVNSKAMSAIACALIAIAEELRIMRNQNTFKEERWQVGE